MAPVEERPEAALDVAVQRLSEGKSGGRSGPGTDPKFAALKRDVKSKQQVVGKHPPPASEASAAQGAARPPADDKEAQGKTANAEKMNAAKPGEFDKAAFVKAVNDAIEKQAPKNLDEADKFGDSGKANAVKGEVQGKVGAGKAASAKAIETTTKAPPDTAAAKEKKVTPLRPDQPPPKPGTPDPARAVPDKAPASATDFSDGPKQVDKQMADAQVTEEQLAKSNEPEFTGALKEKKAGEKQAAVSPGVARAGEAKTLAGAKAQAGQAGAAAMGAMSADRARAGKDVGAGREGAKGEDESKRAQVTAKLQKVFDATKKDVEDILNGLDKKVDEKFDAGEKAARDAFTADYTRKIDAYKDKRYSGLKGKWRWVKDKFAGLPSEVNVFYDQARQGYVQRMQGVISSVADVIGAELGRAKARIAKGRADLQAEVKKLPADLQAIGRQAAGQFAGKFDELTQSVNDKGTQLVDTLASKYTEALKKVDEQIAAEKEKNKGLIAKAVDAVKGVIDTILKLKDLLLGVLAKAAQAVGAIIKDPIGFLGKLVSAVGAGLKAFMANIANHLKKGLVSWLLGAAAKAGLQLPEKFDLKGILLLIGSLLGLTWAAIRGRVVQRGVPEQAMTAVEGSVPVAQKIKSEGIGGMWEEIKDKVGDLKGSLLGKIAQYLIPTVIIAGITWIISLLNPASAFVKACKAIIDIVTFIIERGAQIITFVNAVLDAVIAIAGGGAGGVPGLIENALALSIPVLIGFLAALLGIGGLADKVKKLFQSLSKPVMKAVDWVVGKIAGLAKKLWAKLKNKFGKGKDKRSDEDKQKALDAGLDEADALVMAKLPPSQIRSKLPAIKAKHKMSSLDLVVDEKTETEQTVHVVGQVNPTAQRPQRKLQTFKYDPAERTVPQLWNDCLLQNRYTSSETSAQATERTQKARAALVGNGAQMPILEAILKANDGAAPRSFVSVADEDRYGGHTVVKHVRGGGTVADERALARRILHGIPPPWPVDLASYFVSTAEANTAVGLVIRERLAREWKGRYRDQIARGSGTEFSVSVGPIGYALQVNTAVASRGQMPSYMAGGGYPGPMYPGDPRASQPTLPPMTIPVTIESVLVTIAVDPAAPGGWYVVRAYPAR